LSSSNRVRECVFCSMPNEILQIMRRHNSGTNNTLFIKEDFHVLYTYIYIYILIVCLCMTTLTEVFPCFFLSCKANARVKPAKTGHGPHSSKFLCYSMYFLCCSMYCLFCVVLCIVCVCMCTEQLPPGGYPIAVKYII